MIACEDAQATRIDRHGFVDSKLRGKVSDGPGSQHAGVDGSPGMFRLEILLMAPVGIVDPTVQDELAHALLERLQGKLSEECNRIVIELLPQHGIQFVEKGCGFLIPTPPEIPGERPKTFLRRSKKPVQCTRFTHNWGHLRCSLYEHLNLVLIKNTGFDRLNHQDSLENAAIDQGNAEKRMKGVLTGFLKVLESRMRRRLLHGDRTDRLGYKARESFSQRKAEYTHAFPSETERRRKNEIRTIGLQQICRADIGLKTFRDERNDIRKGLSWLAGFARKIANLFEGKNVISRAAT